MSLVDRVRASPAAQLVVVVAALLAMGSAVQLAASHASPFHRGLATKHEVRVAIGLAVMIVVARTRFDTLVRWAPTAALGATAAIASATLGGGRWVVAGSLHFQPSEVAKLPLLVALAAGVARGGRRAIEAVLLVVLAAALTLRQPDLGTAAMIFLPAWIVLLASPLPRAQRAGASALVAAAIALALTHLRGYQRARVDALVAMWRGGEVPYQAGKAITLFGAGGLFGHGFDAFGASEPYRLPNAPTDMPSAVWAYEQGAIGFTAMVLAFVALGAVGLGIASRAKTEAARGVAIGVTSLLVGQAIVNLGMTLGLLPIVGVPLPFVSFGGSSMGMTLAGVGVLVAIAREAEPQPAGGPLETTTIDARSSRSPI